MKAKRQASLHHAPIGSTPGPWSIQSTPANAIFQWIVRSMTVRRGPWGRWREFDVEPRMEPKLSPALQNTARPGTSLMHLPLLARGRHGT